MVVNDGYQLILGELRTGRITARLPYAGQKWGLRLNGAGPLSATLRPHSLDLAPYPIRSLTTTMKMFMGIQYGDQILEAGPILKRPYDDATGELTLSGLGLWSIFDRRKNIPGAYLLPGARVTEAVKKIAAKHPGSIVRELVRQSIQDNPYGGDLPVVLPASINGSESRTYYGYNLAWLGDDLRDLAKVVDFRFRPRFVAGDATRIEWVLEHGAVDVLTQAGPDWQWDARVEKSGLTGLSVDQDGSGVGAMAWVTGSGQEESMKLAHSAPNTDLTDAGYPWVEVEGDGGSEEDQAVLQSLADREAVDASRPWDTWSVTVRADGDPGTDGVPSRPVLGSYLPGDWAVVNTPENHSILPPGTPARVRILSMDGDSSADVTLTVAPIQGLESTQPEPAYSAALLPSPDLLPSSALIPRAY